MTLRFLALILGLIEASSQEKLGARDKLVFYTYQK